MLIVSITMLIWDLGGLNRYFDNYPILLLVKLTTNKPTEAVNIYAVEF